MDIPQADVVGEDEDDVRPPGRGGWFGRLGSSRRSQNRHEHRDDSLLHEQYLSLIVASEHPGHISGIKPMSNGKVFMFC